MAGFAARLFHFRGDLKQTQSFVDLKARLEALEAAAGPPGKPALLPRHPALGHRRRRRAPRRGGARPPGRRRRVPGRVSSSRSRSGTTSPRPAPSTRRSTPLVPREPDLPHRPLPRQGDDPEPPRLPPRQRHLRAALEPPLRRPRPDHRRRDARRRGAREVLRGVGDLPRHRREPHAPAPLPRGDGAPRRLRGERRPRREGQGPPLDPAADARGDPARHGARPVRPGVDRRSARPRLPAGAERRPGLHPRDVRRVEAPDRELALGRRAVLPPRGQAPARSASPRSPSPSRRPPSPSSGGRASSSRSRTSSSCGSSPTRGSPCASAPSSPARRCASRR